MSGEILFLAHRMPFPPDRGDKIRSSHILRHLAKLAPVHVATFAENDADLAQERVLAEVAASHCLVRRTKSLPLAGAEALLRGEPVSLTAFHNPHLADFVARTLAERPIRTIYVFSGQMGQYVPSSFAGRVVLDFVDVDSAKFEAYSRSGSAPRSWIDRREGRLLQAEETRLARRADCSLLVSEEEATLFRRRLTPADRTVCDVRVLRNGIDSASYDPAQVQPEPRMRAATGPRLIFTGQMDYAPNIAAAERAILRLMPAVRRLIPEATFHVVGRNPPQELRDLHGRNGCFVWGEVPDVRSWLAAADLALVPLELARGVQNKVLEAMAMALPVVLTPSAATGIGARDGEHLCVTESDEDLVTAVTGILADPIAARRIALAARRYVVGDLSWAATLAPLDALVADPARLTSHAA